MKLRIIPTNSSLLAGISYEPGHTSFYAHFVNGEIYHYDSGEDTPAILTDILFDSDSQGKAFSDFKKAGLPYRKLDTAERESMDFHV